MKSIISIAAGTVADHKAVSPSLDVTEFSAQAVVSVAAIVSGGTATAPVSAELQTSATAGGTYTKVAAIPLDGGLVFDTRDCSAYIRVELTLDDATTGATIAVSVAGGVEER